MPDNGKLAPLAVSAALLAGACASTIPLHTPDPVVAGIVSLAMTTPVRDLAIPLDAADAREQYALGSAYDHGLNGLPVFPVMAEYLHARALAARGVMPITQYTPAFNGAPSRVNIVYIPRHDLDQARAAAVDMCFATLAEGRETPPVCREDGVSADQLAALWRAARAR